jgi:hypothetical protein
MTRRQFVAGLASTFAGAVWPMRLHAQPAGKLRRVWVLYGESDPEAAACQRPSAGLRAAGGCRAGISSLAIAGVVRRQLTRPSRRSCRTSSRYHCRQHQCGTAHCKDGAATPIISSSQRAGRAGTRACRDPAAILPVFQSRVHASQMARSLKEAAASQARRLHVQSRQSRIERHPFIGTGGSERVS